MAVVPTQEALLEVDNLRVAYRDAGTVVPIVDGVSFSLRRGEALGLAGESGCGKTTTALALLGLLPSGLRRIGGEMTLNSSRASCTCTGARRAGGASCAGRRSRSSSRAR